MKEIYILVAVLLPILVFWRSRNVEGVRTVRERLDTLGFTNEEDFEAYQGIETESYGESIVNDEDFKIDV